MEKENTQYDTHHEVGIYKEVLVPKVMDKLDIYETYMHLHYNFLMIYCSFILLSHLKDFLCQLMDVYLVKKFLKNFSLL